MLQLKIEQNQLKKWNRHVKKKSKEKNFKLKFDNKKIK